MMLEAPVSQSIEALTAVAALVRATAGPVSYRHWLLKQCMAESMVPPELPAHDGPTLDLPASSDRTSTGGPYRGNPPALRVVPMASPFFVTEGPGKQRFSLPSPFVRVEPETDPPSAA